MLCRRCYILQLCELYDLCHGCLQSVWVFATCCGKVWLTAATSLDEFAGFPNEGSCVLAFLDEVVREGHCERWLAIIHTADDDKQVVCKLATELEGYVFGVLSIERED